MHTRETRHTAHVILSSKELLLLHALASNESVPRTRRHFVAQVLEPDNPAAAVEAALGYRPSGITGGGGGVVGAIKGGSTTTRMGSVEVVDVVEADDSKGWEVGWRGGSAAAASTPRSGKKKKSYFSSSSNNNAGSASARKRSQQRVGSGSGIRVASGATVDRRDRDGDDVEMEDI
jgi:hypothetical protein